DEGRIIVRLDPTAKGEPSRVVVFDPTATNKRGETIAFDHGYASTYHKSQGQSISGVGALGDEMLRSDSIVVGLSRHEHDFKMHIGKDQFEDFSAFARAVAKAPDKDLVADYAVAHRPAHDRVMALKDLSAEYALQMNDCIEKAAAFDKDAWELPEWDTLKDLKKERNELAKEVLDNFPAHRVAVAQARMSRHQIEVMIGKAKPVLSEADRDAFKRVEAYAAMNDACRDKWNEIKATHPGARSKSHPDYEAYCQMRETRDSAAYALTTENGGREAHRRHAKDVGASWRSIESQAAKYLERQRTKEIGQTVEGTTVVVYTQARQEAGKAFAEAVIAAGDDTPGAKARAAADPTYLAARSTRDQAVVAMAAKLKEAGIDPAKLAEEIKRADLLRSPEAELVRKYRNARRLAGSLYGEISSNDYTEAGREKARIDVRYKEYEAARDARNKTVAEIAKNPAKYEHILKAYGFAAGAVQDDDVAQRTGSREKAGYWPAPKAVIVEIQADEARDKLVDAYITAIKAAGIKPEHFARDLATAEMRAREQSPEAKLVREFADTRIEAGKLYVKMTGGDFSPEARLAATKHEDYGQYRGLKERRDAAVTAIAKDKPRYQEWLDAAGIGDEKFAADLKAASSGVREERKTPAPVEQTVKRSAEPVTPSKSTVAAAVPGQENNIAPPKGEPTTLTAIKVVEPVAGPGPQKTTPVPSAVEVENAAIRKALLAKGAGVHEAWRDDEKRPLKSRIAHGIDRVLMSPTLAEPRDEALKQSNALVSLVKQSVRDGKAGDVKAAVAEHEATVKPDQRQNNATISKVLEGVVAKTEQAIPAEKAAEKKITKTMAKSTSMESGIDDDLCR
ncbi:MAG TPA: hypothetical protein VN809_01665, partial [Telmatospirillum sp.]|nr:hypothetical protein [Telmatospirillum sp.]